MSEKKRVKTRWRATATLLAILGVCLLAISVAGSGVLSSPAAPPVAGQAKEKKEDIFNGKFSSKDISLDVNQTVDVSFTMHPTMDAPDTVIKLDIPDDFVKVVKGNTVWKGDVKKGETVKLDFSLVAIQDIDTTLKLDVKAQPLGKDYDYSYYLHFGTSGAKYDKSKGGKLKKISLEGAAPASPGVIKPPLDPSPKPETGPSSEPSSESSSAVASADSTSGPQTPGAGQIEIKGQLQYLNEDGGYSPARYTLVWLRDEDLFGDEWVESQWTDGDGRYDFIVSNDDGFLQGGRDPYVQYYAEGQWGWIGKDGSDNTYFWSDYKTGDDVPSGYVHDYGVRVPTSANESLQAGDAVFTELQWVYWAGTSWERPTKVTVNWPIEDWPHSHGDNIHLPDKATAGWDHVTVHHEYGHSIMWTLYGNSWPDGAVFSSHWVTMEGNLQAAWTEGFAEFMQCAVDNDANNLQSVGQNIETNDWYNEHDAGDMDGANVEGEVASILWDINDPTNTSDNDGMSWGFDDIFWVLQSGDAGVDDNPNSPLDFWDDWLSRWPDLTTSAGPLSTTYWQYGIDKDYYSPTGGSIVINSGAAYTTSRTVSLALSASDYGSGIKEMRFSNDWGSTWSSWLPYATPYSYYMPSAGDGYKFVDVQFRDYTGKTTTAGAIYSGITLDTVAPTGSISINSGAASTNSTAVTLNLTYADATTGVSQVRYSNDGVWDTELWMAPSATKAWTLTSGDGTKTVYYQVKDHAGLVSSYSDTITLNTNGSVSVNSGATYTTTRMVTLSLTPPNPVSADLVMIANEPSFTGRPWISFSATKDWWVTGGEGGKTVYVKYKDNAGNISEVSIDTITLDYTKPTGSISIEGGASYINFQTVALSLAADDITSGMDQMMIANNPSFTGAAWEAYSSTKIWALLAQDGYNTVYIKYKDKAGNISGAYSDVVFVDSKAPTGSISINSGADYCISRQVTLTLSAADAVPSSGITYIMLSNDASFAGSSWVPFATSKSWWLSSGDGAKTVYYKIKDKSGNISQVYLDSITLDSKAPTGSVVINNGDAATISRQVTLTLTATDPFPSSGVPYVMISNDPAFTGAAWVAYAPTKSWWLTTGAGAKTVYVKYKDMVGFESIAYSDSIQYAP